jgi:hypothetical protein
MSDTPSTVTGAMKLYQEAFDKMQQAQRELSGGPQSYYFERILEYVEVLFEKYAPFKAADRIVICKPPNCENGWKCHEQDLQKGAKGTVKAVDYYKGTWRCDVMLDEETWMDGKIRKPCTTKHTFCLKEEEIVKI